MLKQVLMGLLGITIIITLFLFFLSVRDWMYSFI